MISRLNKRESGFTIVELLIVIVVIGILAGLVLNTFNGIQARGRDTDRKNDIRIIHGQLEAYQADKGYYPTTANLADSTWVDQELPGLDAEVLVDPSGGAYAYAAEANCDNTADNCDNYTLSADLEEDGRTTDDADSNTADFEKNSLN